MGERARVGLDVWPATTHAPGVGRYARELTRALAELAGEPDTPRMGLFDVGPGRREFAPAVLGLAPLPAGWKHLAARLPRRALAPLGVLGLGAERLLGGCDLFHRVLPDGPPLGRVRQVLALAEPGPAKGALEARQRAAVAAADAVVVFSDAGRARVVERLGADAGRVHALPVGCDHWRRDAEVVDEPGGDSSDEPLVLALGRTDRARAPLALLGAFEALRAEGVAARLLFCGRPGDEARALREALERSPARAHARWIETPREAELPGLAASAAVLAHLAEDELTPVTPLEALSFGAAVVARPLPAFREAAGDAGHWLADAGAPLEVSALAARLAEALASGVDPAARRARRARAAPFTWRRHARLTVELWHRILAS